MRERGFSLLEIVLTVGILGTLAALAIPFFAKWGSLWQLEYEAARLASEVRYYREVISTFQKVVPFRTALPPYSGSLKRGCLICLK